MMCCYIFKLTYRKSVAGILKEGSDFIFEPCFKVRLSLFIKGLPREFLSDAIKCKNILKNIFIAVIHPIQWAIANPRGTALPAKRKKNLSYVSTSWPVPLCIRQVAHHTSFLSRQRDIIASFLFAACTVQSFNSEA